jgi:glycosyltransferase involved in cell wall biosynthesis
VDVCVITYGNTADRVKAGLRSLDRLWVRDNTTDNIGFARAANELARRGRDDIIVFVNPDGDPRPNCFETLERCFDDPEVVAAEASQGSASGVAATPERFTWLSGACLAVRRTAFEQVGGFDSSLFMYWEDADLSWRLARLGRLVHCWDAVFEHDRAPKSFRSLAYFVRNGLIVQKRWHRNGSLAKETLAAVHALRVGDVSLAAAEGAGSLAYLAHRLNRSTPEDSGAGVRPLPTRVLHLADMVNRFDFVDNVLRHLNRSRFESEVCTFTSEVNIAPPEYAEASICHKVLGIDSRQQYPFAGLRLANLLRSRGIDIVHAHHFDPNTLAWLATNLHRSSRVVVGRHYSDAVYIHTSGLKRRAMLAVERLVNSHAARIVVPSTMIRDLLVLRQGVPEEKVEVIPYPFDPARYQILSLGERTARRAELGLTSRFGVATIGRIFHDKGHRYMIEAIRQVHEDLPDLVWLVVGDGPDRASLEAAIRQNGLDGCVRLLGWRSDALQINGAVDAVVQPSIQEGYSQVMVEALWMGTPLLTTDVSGAQDLVTNGETGLVVRKADPSALAEALRSLYRDARLRGDLARRGRQHVETHHSLTAIVPRFEKVYTEVLDQ